MSTTIVLPGAKVTKTVDVVTPFLQYAKETYGTEPAQLQPLFTAFQTQRTLVARLNAERDYTPTDASERRKPGKSPLYLEVA